MQASGSDGYTTRAEAAYPAFPLRLKLLRWVGRQTWLPKGQDWILRKIWHPETGQAFPFVADFFGMRYPGDIARTIDWNVWAYGSYAYSELTLLNDLSSWLHKKRDTVTFFDAGANVGHHTLYMAGRADKVIAFEPFAVVRELIQQKLELNRLSCVTVLPVALGEKDETLRYYPGGKGNSGAGTFLPEEIGTYEEPVEIRVCNGDRLFAELALPRMDILKMDVEGFEPLVLRGLSSRMHQDRPMVLMELNARSRSGFGSEAGFRSAFWDGALFAEVRGRRGCPFKLKPLHYETADEVLILPPEAAEFMQGKLTA